MAFWANWFNRTERRSYDTLWRLFGMGDGTTRSASYASLRNDMAECAVVRAGLDFIAEGLSSLRYPVAVNGDQLEDGKEPPALQPLIALIKRPNPNQALSEFQQKWVYHRYLGGMAFTRGINIGTQTLGDYTRPKSGAELYLLSPDCVRTVHKDMRVERYEYRPKDGQLVNLKPEEVVVHRFPHPDDDFAGLTPLASVRNEINALIEASKWQATTLKNLAVPAGILSLEKFHLLDPETKKQVREDFSSKFAGAVNAGKTFFSGAEARYTPLATTPRELDWINSDAAMMRKVCAAMRVPSILLGDPAQTTYANYEQARAAFYEQTIIPLARHFTEEYNFGFFNRYGDGVAIEVDYSEIDALGENETEKYTRLSLADWLKIDEKREQCGYEPLPDGEGDALNAAPAYDPFAMEPPEDEEEGKPPKGKEGRNIVPFRKAPTPRMRNVGAK